MTVKGDFGTLNRFKRLLRSLSTSVAHDVAQRAAPEMTALARGAYDSGRTVYGQTRPPGVRGNALSLVQSGATRAQLQFRASGTIVRASLGTRYAKYLVGKYGILPLGNIPFEWQRRLRVIAADVIRKRAERAA